MPIEIVYLVGKGEVSRRHITPEEFIERVLDHYGPHAFIQDDEVQAQRRLQAQLDNIGEK